MPHGRPTRVKICLTTQERHTIESWQRMQTIPAGRARRGRILLLLEAGMPITEVAKMVGISRRFVYKWVARFQAQGVTGLHDQPRPHRRRPREHSPCAGGGGR